MPKTIGIHIENVLRKLECIIILFYVCLIVHNSKFTIFSLMKVVKHNFKCSSVYHVIGCKSMEY